MGLDNGIILVTRTPIDLEMLPSYTRIEKLNAKENKHEYEICYWRKCWGVRNDILSLCSNEEEYEYDITRKIKEIQDILVGYLTNPDSWKDSGNTYWELEVMADTIAYQIINLSWLMNYLEDDVQKKCVVTFYDSY